MRLAKRVSKHDLYSTTREDGGCFFLLLTDQKIFLRETLIIVLDRYCVVMEIFANIMNSQFIIKSGYSINFTYT